ncbi:hypothetical protein POMI540_2967 [Schizosaccharomyces pombe]
MMVVVPPIMVVVKEKVLVNVVGSVSSCWVTAASSTCSGGFNGRSYNLSSFKCRSFSNFGNTSRGSSTGGSNGASSTSGRNDTALRGTSSGTSTGCRTRSRTKGFSRDDAASQSRAQSAKGRRST